MNISAAVRIPRDGEFLFFGKFLDGIDSDISMHKRAREVAGRIAKPRFCNASRRQRFRSATSFSSRGRVQSFRARGRGFRRPVRGRGAACGRATSVWSAASASSRKWLILGVFRVCGDPPVGGRISLFCRHVASSHIRCRCSFCCAIWFPIFGLKAIFRVSYGKFPWLRRILWWSFASKRRYVIWFRRLQIDDVPNLCLSPIFVIP